MELKGAEIRNLMELCNPMPKNGTENRKLNVLIPYYQRRNTDKKSVCRLF